MTGLSALLLRLFLCSHLERAPLGLGRSPFSLPSDISQGSRESQGHRVSQGKLRVPVSPVTFISKGMVYSSGDRIMDHCMKTFKRGLGTKLCRDAGVGRECDTMNVEFGKCPHGRNRPMVGQMGVAEWQDCSTSQVAAGGSVFIGIPLRWS